MEHLKDFNAHSTNTTILQYNACYRLVPSGTDRETNNGNNIEPYHHPTHSPMTLNSLNLSSNYVNEELYWDPANHEEDIMKQLTKLTVENMHKDKIE